MLFLENNNIFSDCIKKESKQRNESKKKANGNHATEDGLISKMKSFFGELFFKMRLHTKYTLAPIIKVLPGLLFRVFTYCILLSYLSNFYRGFGLLLPLLLFSVVTALGLFVGIRILKIKKEEAVVNSFCGIVLPIYLDIFPVVINYYTSYV